MVAAKVLPQHLKERIGTAGNPLWDCFLSQRLDSAVASKGVWIANDIEKITCVAQGEVEIGLVHVFCRDPATDALTIIGVLCQVTEMPLQEHDVITLRFSALDRRLLTTTRQFLQDHCAIERSHECRCGVFIHGNSHPAPTKLPILPSNANLRSLVIDDAEVMNSRWEHGRGQDSLTMVQK